MSSDIFEVAEKIKAVKETGFTTIICRRCGALVHIYMDLEWQTPWLCGQCEYDLTDEDRQRDRRNLLVLAAAGLHPCPLRPDQH